MALKARRDAVPVNAARSLALEPVPPCRGFSPVETENTTPLATTGGSGTDIDSEIHIGTSEGFSFSTPSWNAMMLPLSCIPQILLNLGSGFVGGPQMGTYNHRCP